MNNDFALLITMLWFRAIFLNIKILIIYPRPKYCIQNGVGAKVLRPDHD
ncbi:hypothetical protein KAU33_05080 [Candidatus Dependentiae bacterium]|nr:hypothetical protein [Candidatus Dependentiae bacterium]